MSAMKLVKKALAEEIGLVVSGDKLELYQLRGRVRATLGSEIYSRESEIVAIVKRHGFRHSSGNTALLCSTEQLPSAES